MHWAGPGSSVDVFKAYVCFQPCGRGGISILGGSVRGTFGVVLVASWIVLGCALAVLRSLVTVAGSGLLCRIGGQHWLPVEMGPVAVRAFHSGSACGRLGVSEGRLGTFVVR